MIDRTVRGATSVRRSVFTTLLAVAACGARSDTILSSPSGSGDASGALSAGADADLPGVCEAPPAGTLFVDPADGRDDASSTGSIGCPFRSLTHALSLLGDAGAPMTVEIVNTRAPTLSQATGEVFPITLPAGATITTLDTTTNTPTISVPATPYTGALPCPFSGGCADGFLLDSSNTHLSHLIIDGRGTWDALPILITSSSSVSVDHVTVQNFLGASTDVTVDVAGSAADGPSAGRLLLGPGFALQALNLSSCALLVRGGTATIVGGHGADHSSFEGGGVGICVMEQGSVDIEGATIDPIHPEVSDVDADGDGVFLDALEPSFRSTVRGLHIAHASLAVKAARSLTMRGCYVGGNGSGVEVVQAPQLAIVVDLGTAADPGRNIFVSNETFDICPALYYTMDAVGNLFGNVDCAVGGWLDPSRFCDEPSADINLGRCTF